MQLALVLLLVLVLLSITQDRVCGARQTSTWAA